MKKDLEKRPISQSTYYLTAQEKTINGFSRGISDKRISEYDYQRFLLDHDICG